MLKGEIKKENLIKLSEKLFFERGYNQTSIQQLVEAFQCTKGSFYHHFESKLQILSEVCARRSEMAFAAYQQKDYHRPLEKLNGLLYHAVPFRHGEEEMMALLLPLAGTTESDVVLQAILKAQEALFRPEMEAVLEQLKAEGTVYYTLPSVPQLLWDTYTALYRRLLTLMPSAREAVCAQEINENLRAARFMWERLLDAPFAGVEIVRADEITFAMRNAILRAERRDQQL